MELSKRLEAVAGLVTPGNRLADVGTDHGYIPIYLTEAKKIPYAIAMDVNQGPLTGARAHILESGLEDRIELRLSDGLKRLKPGEADSAVIAGMGGALTIRILEEGKETADRLKELVLQPQSEIRRVREWLWEHGYCIEAEDMVLEDGKYYPMMRVVHGKMEPLGEAETLYGPLLLKEKHPCLASYLCWERQVKEKVLEQLKLAGEGAVERREEVKRALLLNEEAMQRLLQGCREDGEKI